MVYISSWHEYQEAAEALYAKSPNDTRYCVKWKSSEGKLVLKITDNITCLKFKTYSSIFLNRFEALNLSLMQKMQNRRPEDPSSSASATTTTTSKPTTLKPTQAGAAGAVSKPADAAKTPTTTSTVVPSAQGAPIAGGVKKKKPKKKK